MAYRMAPVSVILNDLEGHSPAAGLFKGNPSNICAAFYQNQLTARSRGPSASAGLLVPVTCAHDKSSRADADDQLNLSHTTTITAPASTAVLVAISH